MGAQRLVLRTVQQLGAACLHQPSEPSTTPSVLMVLGGLHRPHQVLMVLGGLRLVVRQDVAVLVLDAEPPGGVSGLLMSVAEHRLDGAVGILSSLVVGRVHLLLTRVELDLLGAVPMKE